MDSILILGASSDIAKALAEKYAQEKYDLYLTSKKYDDIKTFSEKLKEKYSINVNCFELNILDTYSHKNFYNSINKKPFGVITAIGYLGNQKLAQNSFEEHKKIVLTNYLAIASLLNIVANDFEKRKSGFIIGISSVAGDRGRKSNYIYGSSKSGFSTYLSGLRNRLYKSNVNVLTVKPGFVFTKMTKDMNLPRKLTSNPKEVAELIYKAQKNNRSVLYVKQIWSLIMFIIKLIPEWKFKKMDL